MRLGGRPGRSRFRWGPHHALATKLADFSGTGVGRDIHAAVIAHAAGDADQPCLRSTPIATNAAYSGRGRLGARPDNRRILLA
jgi:hypothetical protein